MFKNMLEKLADYVEAISMSESYEEANEFANKAIGYMECMQYIVHTEKAEGMNSKMNLLKYFMYEALADVAVTTNQSKELQDELNRIANNAKMEARKTV